jgi:hypothetical protein
MLCNVNLCNFMLCDIVVYIVEYSSAEKKNRKAINNLMKTHTRDACEHNDILNKTYIQHMIPYVHTFVNKNDLL